MNAREDRLAELEALAEELNSATDTLTASLLEIENRLRQMGIGLSATIPLSGGEWQLSFMRWQDEFRIVVFGPNGAGTLIGSAPRTIRIEAASHIDELLIAVIAKARALVAAAKLLRERRPDAITPPPDQST